MAGSNGHVNAAAKSVAASEPLKRAAAEEVLKLPTIDELRRAFEEGIPQTLLSGVEVQMRPVQADRLLDAPSLPNQLTELVMTMMFPPPKPEPGPETFPDEAELSPVNDFLMQRRERVESLRGFAESVNVVCAAALVDASILPYLSLEDRMWLFRLAFMPVAVLSRFRLRPQTDVGTVADGEGDEQQAEQLAAVDAEPVPPEPADSLPV